MEYMQREDLGRLATAGQENGVPLSLDCALTVAAGLCAGLHYAHEKAAPEADRWAIIEFVTLRAHEFDPTMDRCRYPRCATR
jgi:hypothetical protein